MNSKERKPHLKSILADFKSLLLSVKSKSLNNTKATEDLGKINKKIQAYGANYGSKGTCLLTLIDFSKEAKGVIEEELG